MRLNALEIHLLFLLISMHALYVHHIVSTCILQNLNQKCIEQKCIFLFIYLDFSSFIYSKLNSVQHFKSQYLRWVNPKSSTTDI